LRRLQPVGSQLVIVADAALRDNARVAARRGPRQMLHGAGAGGEHDRQRERRGPARRARLVVDRHAEDAAHAIEQRSAGRGHRQQRDIGSPRFERGERFRVGDGVAAHAHRHFIAAVLALGANPLREPPHRGVIEEQRLGDGLQQVDKVVVTADVRQFVRENRFHLRRRQRGHRGNRQQNRRTQPADDGRHVDARRLDDMRRRGQAEPIRDAPARRLPARRSRRERVAMQTTDVPPAAGHPREQEDDAGEPGEGDAVDEPIDLVRRESAPTILSLWKGGARADVRVRRSGHRGWSASLQASIG
jgi:hypothetical protein